MKKSAFCLLIVGVFLLGSAAHAHEFIIKPAMMHGTSQESVGFSAVSAHTFMVSEEMEPLDKVDVSVVSDKGKIPVTLRENPVLMTLDGRAPLIKEEGFTVLYGHRSPIVWSKTVSGWKEGGKKGDKGVISCNGYEKFCKTLIRSGKGTTGFDKKVNCRLEIVPKTNPADVRPGMDMTVEILYEGQPLGTEVLATYDGFSTQANTYAYYTQCSGSGLATVKITHPGLWMIRVQKETKAKDSGYDAHFMRSVLVFEIR